RDSIASPAEFSTRSTYTSTSSPIWSSAFWPGAANSRSATRPSDFRPTSMTAMSFSIPVTVPFTTLPSKASFSPPRLSLRRAAKSSRVGNVVVAIRLLSLETSNSLAAPRHHGEAPACGPGCTNCRVRLIPMRRPQPFPWQKARRGAGRLPVYRTRSPKDGLPPMLNEHPPDGARLSLEVVRGQASPGRLPQAKLLASLPAALAVETLQNLGIGNFLLIIGNE